MREWAYLVIGQVLNPLVSSEMKRFPFGTPANVGCCQDADLVVINGAFKSVPFLLIRIVGIWRLFGVPRRLPRIFELLSGKLQLLFRRSFTKARIFGIVRPAVNTCSTMSVSQPDPLPQSEDAILVSSFYQGHLQFLINFTAMGIVLIYSVSI